MAKRYKSEEERRRYLRLDTVFPVSFRLISPDAKHFLSDWIQGFTCNVSKGGICLAVNNLKKELAELLKEKKAYLSLDIEIPILKKPVAAEARVTWVKDSSSDADIGRYLFGLAYEKIDADQNNKIMRYAWARKLFIPAAAALIIILGIILGVNTYINSKLIKGNKALVEQLVKIIQDSSIAKQKIKEISKEKEDLHVKIQALRLKIQTVEEEKALTDKKIAAEEKESSVKIRELGELIDSLNKEKEALQDKLIAVQNQENVVTEELLRLDKRKVALEKGNFDNMYQWLKVHQNPRTGLVMSFEGDTAIKDVAFLYDQALVVQAYINFSDFEKARKILDFFAKKAKRMSGFFLNAYYTNDGQPAEYIAHSGPNIWLGIAIAQYTNKTQDKTYLSLAEGIGGVIINLQDLDAEGGIRGGPETEWYATEHNLDAYAFFGMLYRLTGRNIYLEAQDKALNWLIKHTYDKTDLPIKRGKGDSTIATDTYAWSIAAIGPEKLQQIGMNPDRIMEFAEQNCAVTVDYKRPGGQAVKIKGFDFASQRHSSRGGVVSSEWTAQMVISFKIMSNYYYKKEMIAKSRTYAMKADDYLSQLGNMIISSPSPSGQGESCLPYATQDFVDTGHGWMTPKGKSTGSVAGTAYALFAYYNYNPLTLDN